MEHIALPAYVLKENVVRIQHVLRLIFIIQTAVTVCLAAIISNVNPKAVSKTYAKILKILVLIHLQRQK
jgi:hypothetical protein